ncbi:hypothetical protein VP01_303g3 [Puccinia sorghi]|uniref:Uncharacterized protein n=1 Tax=Puccinia sorghi TaxID=27349 RepID=A0A0L6V1T5_9BASI|nr:hypothetical protein VP01_303g3 [Puccinia sorghi]
MSHGPRARAGAAISKGDPRRPHSWVPPVAYSPPWSRSRPKAGEEDTAGCTLVNADLLCSPVCFSFACANTRTKTTDNMKQNEMASTDSFSINDVHVNLDTMAVLKLRHPVQPRVVGMYENTAFLGMLYTGKTRIDSTERKNCTLLKDLPELLTPREIRCNLKLAQIKITCFVFLVPPIIMFMNVSKKHELAAQGGSVGKEVSPVVVDGFGAAGTDPWLGWLCYKCPGSLEWCTGGWSWLPLVSGGFSCTWHPRAGRAGIDVIWTVGDLSNFNCWPSKFITEKLFPFFLKLYIAFYTHVEVCQICTMCSHHWIYTTPWAGRFQPRNLTQVAATVGIRGYTHFSQTFGSLGAPIQSLCAPQVVIFGQKHMYTSMISFVHFMSPEFFSSMQLRGHCQCLKMFRPLGALIQKLCVSRHCGNFKILPISFGVGALQQLPWRRKELVGLLSKLTSAKLWELFDQKLGSCFPKQKKHHKNCFSFSPIITFLKTREMNATWIPVCPNFPEMMLSWFGGGSRLSSNFLPIAFDVEESLKSAVRKRRSTNHSSSILFQDICPDGADLGPWIQISPSSLLRLVHPTQPASELKIKIKICGSEKYSGCCND